MLYMYHVHVIVYANKDDDYYYIYILYNVLTFMFTCKLYLYIVNRIIINEFLSYEHYL